jgi:Syndecan domain
MFSYRDSSVVFGPYVYQAVIIVSTLIFVAAAVGVAGLIIVVICLLIICIVYRFRKKDEGSYALDEPHRVSGLAVSKYTRAPSQDREFFA